MNDNMKEKIANRTAYAILALLLIAALTFTVIAIVSTVNQKKKPLPDDTNETPPADNSGEQAGEQNGDQNGAPSGEQSGNQNNDPNNDQNGSSSEDQTGDQNNNNQAPPAEEDKKPDTQVFVLPAEGYVMREFSDDVLVFSPTMNDYRVHMGVDIAGKVGDPVYAFCEGTVKEISNHPFMGKTVVLTHANGIESRYMNLAEQLPENITVDSFMPVVWICRRRKA